LGIALVTLHVGLHTFHLVWAHPNSLTFHQPPGVHTLRPIRKCTRTHTHTYSDPYRDDESFPIWRCGSAPGTWEEEERRGGVALGNGCASVSIQNPYARDEPLWGLRETAKEGTLLRGLSVLINTFVKMWLGRNLWTHTVSSKPI
jgi:hypothetical protein